MGRCKKDWKRLLPADPDAALHRINQDYSRGYLAGLFGDLPRENGLSEYRQGFTEGTLARVIEEDAASRK